MRLYIYAALALALLAGLGYVHHLQKKAARVDAAEAKAVSYKASLDKTASLLKQSEADRIALNTGLRTITDRFNSIVIPPPKTLVKVKEIPGACPTVSVSPQFVGVWNAASSP